MQEYQVTPYRNHQLAPVMNFVGAPLASSTLDYPFQRQAEKQDQLLGNVPHAHMPELTLADYAKAYVIDFNSVSRSNH